MNDAVAQPPAAGDRDRCWRLALGAALAFAASLLVWRFVDDPALWELLRPYGRGDPQWHQLWNLTTNVVRGPATIGVVLVLAVAARDPQRRQLLLVAPLLAGLLVFALKVLVGRERPDGDGGAWPSGHAATAFTLAIALSLGRRRPRLSVWVAAVVVASSRVVLERHWPSDVVAGLGAACVAVAVASRLPALPVRRLDDGRVVLLLGLVVLALTLASLLVFDRAVHAARGWAGLFGLGLCLRALSVLERGARTDPTGSAAP